MSRRNTFDVFVDKFVDNTKFFLLWLLTVAGLLVVFGSIMGYIIYSLAETANKERESRASKITLQLQEQDTSDGAFSVILKNVSKEPVENIKVYCEATMRSGRAYSTFNTAYVKLAPSQQTELTINELGFYKNMYDPQSYRSMPIEQITQLKCEIADTGFEHS